MPVPASISWKWMSNCVPVGMAETSRNKSSRAIPCSSVVIVCPVRPFPRVSHAVLVHWPSRNMNLPAIFETLLKLKQEGRTRAIGVANFNLALLKAAVEQIKAPIACNQVEYHVMLDQTKVAKYLAAKSIPLVAYAPLAQGRVASDETLISIGRKHGASAAQVALKWLLDQDSVAAIPKTSRAESQRANLDALKLKLDDEDRKAIAALPKDKRFVNPGFAPGWD